MLTDENKQQRKKDANYLQESYVIEIRDSDSERLARFCVSMPLLIQQL